MVFNLVMIYSAAGILYPALSDNGVYFQRIGTSGAGYSPQVTPGIGDALSGPKNLRKMEKENRIRRESPR